MAFAENTPHQLSRAFLLINFTRIVDGSLVALFLIRQDVFVHQTMIAAETRDGQESFRSLKEKETVRV